MAVKATTTAPLRIESLRLEPGSHASPDQGVCIVELASILAREKFSDEPDCVCDVIGAFLRSWNDRASYVDRQRLRPYAARIVGTSGGRAVTRKRRDICLVWSGLAELDGGPLSRSLERLRARIRIGWRLGIRSALRLKRGAGEYAALVCFSRHGSEATFRLLDRLLAVGDEEAGPAVARGRAPGEAERAARFERRRQRQRPRQGQRERERRGQASLRARRPPRTCRDRARRATIPKTGPWPPRTETATPPLPAAAPLAPDARGLVRPQSGAAFPEPQ